MEQEALKGPDLRLEQAPYPSAQLFHNYGHGGSGVTMSWGCAIEIMNLIRVRLGIEFPEFKPQSKIIENPYVLNGLLRLVADCKQAKSAILS